MNKNDFKLNFEETYSFLLCFTEQAYEDISDEDIMEEYLFFDAEAIKDYKTKLLPEAYEVLSLDPFPKDAVELTAIIWFESADETKAWLKEVISKLEKRIAKAEAEGK